MFVFVRQDYLPLLLQEIFPEMGKRSVTEIMNETGDTDAEFVLISDQL